MAGLFGAKKTQINNTETVLGAVQVQNSAQGLPIPIVYGTTRITGNNIWYGDFTAVPHTDTQESGGGKGGGGGVTTTNTTYTYTTGVAIGLCEGPISGIGQIWEQKNVTTAAALGLTEFTGSYAQAPWSYLTSNHPSEALGYRGLAYVANAAYQLGNSGSLPNLSFEVGGIAGTVSWLATPGATFSPTNKASNLVLSNLNRTVTGNGLGAFGANPGSVQVISPFGPLTTFTVVINADAAGGAKYALGGWPVGADYSDIAYMGAPGFSNNGASWQSSGSSFGYMGADAPAPTAGSFVYDTGYGAANDRVTVSIDGGQISYRVNGVSQGVAQSVPPDPRPNGFAAGLGSAVTLWMAGGSQVTLESEVSYKNSLTPSSQTDVSPAYVLCDLLTNDYYGASFPLAQIGDLTAFNSYCDAAGIAISPAYTAQRSAMDICTELCQIGNSAPFWSEGVLKVTPYADAAVGAFTPDTTVQYQLTDDDFLGDPPVKVLRKRPADAYNSLVVQCKDRANNYNNATPAADDQASIDRYGPRPMPMITFDAICVPSIGRIVAQNSLTRALYYLNTYEFTLGWKYSRLEAMDLVGLTDAAVGLNQTTVRILTIEEDEDGNLRMTAEDFNPGVSNSATYGTQASGGYIVNQAVAPGDANAPVIFQPSLALFGTPEVWLGTSGGVDWGGAEVWLSSDNTTYTKFGTITAPARHGVLTGTLAAGADPDSVNTLAVDLTVSAGALITVPLAQADALITLCYVDGELLAYETATLTSAYHYDLTYLRRGQYWSASSAHSAGTKFMRLDDAVFKTACPESWVGSTIYVKLLSFNKFGGGLQSLADVSPTTYVVQPVDMVLTNGVVPDTVPANQRLYIPAGAQFSIAQQMTVLGEIMCLGQLTIN